jgi:PAS domain S-box-containing protein
MLITSKQSYLSTQLRNTHYASSFRVAMKLSRKTTILTVATFIGLVFIFLVIFDVILLNALTPIEQKTFGESLRKVRYILAALFVFCFVFCSMMLAVFRSVVLKRLALLGEKARQISRECDFSSRLTVTENNDELDDLAGAVNGMLESLEQTEYAFSESEKQYRTLFERAPESIFLIGLEGDETGRIVAVNKAAAELHGYTIEELHSMSIHDLNTPETNPVSRGVMARLLKGEWVTFEIWHVKKSGTRFPLEVHAGTVDLKGRKYVLGFDRDITSRKQAEEADHIYMDHIQLLNNELARHASQLAIANHELETFNYSVSHDMRGPLTRISGYCQLMLEDEPALGPQVREYINRVYESCNWLNEMIETMLRLSQLVRGEYTPGPVDLSGLVEKLVDEFKMSETVRKTEVVIAPGVTVVGDERLLKILMTNLLDNALKYTAYTDSPRIEFGVVNDGTEPVYFLGDNGAGFDMKDVDRLFRVFTRLHDPELFTGNGIGLATVQRIIARHGGRIWAEGEPQGGATFYFTLPSEELLTSPAYAP